MAFMKPVAVLLLAPVFALVSTVMPAAWSQALPSEEVPFVTTPDNVTLEMLGIAGVGPSDFVLDLGSGDGRIVITAARRFGARGMGVEIVPDLVRRSNDNARAAGVAERAQFREQDLFQTDLAQASVITMYLLPEVNLQLRPGLLALKPGTRVVSHDWDMGEWKPDRTVVVPVPDKKLGLEKSSKVHLWIVPARVAGLWCGVGLLQGMDVRMEQSFQHYRGSVTRGARVRAIEGRIQGNRLEPAAGAAAAIGLEAAGESLKIAAAPGELAALRGAEFRRATGASCPA
jgi:SAM-dependent methyltransferase